jgi:hypothetical protein
MKIVALGAGLSSGEQPQHEDQRHIDSYPGRDAK